MFLWNLWNWALSFCQTPSRSLYLKWQPRFVLVRGQSISILAKPVGQLEYRMIANDATGSQYQILQNNWSFFSFDSTPLCLSLSLLPCKIFTYKRKFSTLASWNSRAHEFLSRQISLRETCYIPDRISGSSIRRVDVARAIEGSLQDTQEQWVITRATDHYPDGAAESPGHRVVLGCS